MSTPLQAFCCVHIWAGALQNSSVAGRPRGSQAAEQAGDSLEVGGLSALFFVTADGLDRHGGAQFLLADGLKHGLRDALDDCDPLLAIIVGGGSGVGCRFCVWGGRRPCPSRRRCQQCGFQEGSSGSQCFLEL
jgi:hypothetical protein